MASVALIAPDGTPGEVPEEQVKAAIAAGAKLAPVSTPIAPGMPVVEHEAPELPTDPNSAAKGFVLPVMLRDKATGESRPVDPNDVPKLLAAGSHEVADPKAPVRLVSPDGTLGEVPAGSLADALKAGGRLPTDAELEGEGIKQAAHENLGAGEAAMLGLGAPMQGIVEAVGQRTGLLPKDLSATHQAAEANIEEHPGAYWPGRVAGEVASAVATGGLAEGATAAAGLKGLAKVAAEGAVYAVEPTATALVNKDPAGAAEALALGVASNIGLHAVFSLGGKVAGALAERAAPVVDEEARRVAENRVLKDLGVPGAKMEEARGKLPELLKAAGITAEDNQAAALKKIASLEESGGRIGKAMEALDKAPGREGILFDSLGKASQELESVTARMVGPEAEQTAKALKPIQEQLQAIAAKPETSFADTQALKRFIGEQTNFSDNKLANRVRQEAYAVVRSNLEEAENKAAAEVGGGDIFEALKADRALYTLHKFFGTYAERQAGKEVTESTLAHLHVARHGLAAMAGHLVGLPAPVSVALSVGELALRKRLKGRVFGDAVKAVQGSTTPNTTLALDAIKAMDTRIASGAKDLLSSLASRKVAESPINDTIGRFLPSGGVGQSRAAQIASLRNAVNQHQDNPAGVADHLGTITAPLHEEGLGPVAEAYTQHQLRLMKVIQAILPSDPKMAMPHPFAANVAPEDISPATHARINRALTVAGDPDTLLGLVKQNTISATDVAIAEATNPSYLQRMRRALVDEALKSKPDMTYQQRLSMDILMGQNIDESTAQLPVLQAAFVLPPPSGTTGTPKPIKTDEKKSEQMASAFLPDSAKNVVSAR